MTVTTSERAVALRRIHETTERVLEQGEIVAASDRSVHAVAPVAVSRAEGEALRNWVVRARAGETIEIGLGYGISALFICDGFLRVGDPSARHVVIDPHQVTRFASCGIQLLDEAGLTAMAEPYVEDSQLVLPRLLSSGRRFDFAFVDGNHRFDAVFVDLYYLGRLVRPGGVIVVDDYQLPGIVRAISFWVTNLGWSLDETSSVDADHHWCVLRTATHPDARRFDDFVNF